MNRTLNKPMCVIRVQQPKWLVAINHARLKAEHLM